MVARALVVVSIALPALGGCNDRDASVAASTVELTESPTQPAPGAARPVRGTVSRAVIVYVSDGDTVGVRMSGTVRRVRLLGIDAPETKDPDEPVGCYGPQASARARALLPRGLSVTVVTDPSQDLVDRFGRTLAYVFRPRETRPVNERLLRDGAARVYVYRRGHPFRRIGAFRAAEAEARAVGRGLWAACGPK